MYLLWQLWAGADRAYGDGLYSIFHEHEPWLHKFLAG
jgi:hypothetical protein